LILDGCSAHDGDFFLDLCLEDNVIPFPIPPHSPNQVQPLDLRVFGITKGLVTRLNQTGEADIQSLHIAKLFSAFHSARNRVNIIAFFRNAGMILHLEEEASPMCYVDIEQCRYLLDQLDVPSTGAQ
jgi:hypothetical protein